MKGQLQKKLVSLISLTCFWLSLAAPLFAAQQPTGSIEGLVTDPQGAVVSNAAVVARNTATGLTRTVNAGDDGRYRIAQLPPGVYEVKVTAQNFKSTVVSDIKVDVGQNVPLDVKLEIGGTTETVTVTGAGEERVLSRRRPAGGDIHGDEGTRTLYGTGIVESSEGIETGRGNVE